MPDNGSSRRSGADKISDIVRQDQSKVPPSRYGGRPKLLLIVAVLVVVADQLSKLWIGANRPQIELLPGFLDLRYTQNTGAIFGLFHTHTEVFIGLGIAGVIVVLVFLRYFPPTTALGVVSFALILSGAVGNLIDRIRLGYVIDFVSLHWRNVFFWPSFNVADAALVIGILALIYYFYRSGVFGKAYERTSKPQS